MFLIVRGIFALVILIVLIIVTTQTRFKKRFWAYLICLGLTYGIFVASRSIRPEIYFLKFESPEAAVEYYYPLSKGTIIEGENSALIAENRELILKTGNEWALAPSSEKYKKEYQPYRFFPKDGEVMMWLIESVLTKEYYVDIHRHLGEPIHVEDNLGTDFIYDTNPDFPSESYCMYRAYLGKISPGYTIYCGEKTYEFTGEALVVVE